MEILNESAQGLGELREQVRRRRDAGRALSVWKSEGVNGVNLCSTVG